MLKNIIVLIILSIAVIFGSHHIQPLITALVSAHDWISQLLLQVFAGGQAGSIVRQLLASLAMPIFIGLVPAAIYWVAKRRFFPYFMHVVWVVWLIQTTAMIMMYKVAIV